MNKIIAIAIAGSFLAGCVNQGGKLGADSKLIQENEHRLASLEESIDALNSQVAQLNNRVYEVRTKTGQKTSMTVVPVIKNPPAPAAAPAPRTAQPAQEAAAPATLPTATAQPAPPPQTAAPAAQPAPRQPAGRKIDPKAKPGPLPAKAASAPRAQPASGSIGAPAAAAAPLAEPGLPPAELPPDSIPPVPQGNVTPAPQGHVEPVPQGNVAPQLPPMEEAPSIPLPVAPVSDLALPPEQPLAQAAPAQTASAPKTASGQRRSAPAARGEQAAYNAALSAARSGRTAEGIRLFRDFLQKYPNGPYAANAEYWIGECLYSQGKYQDALSEFQAVNNSYPSHHKNADALLKAGITLGKMGDKAGAAEKFRTLIANFPNSEAARRARAMGAN